MMYRLLSSLIIILLSVPCFGQYSGGSGTAADPYLISDAEDLVLLGNTEEDWDKHFVLVSEIDLSGEVLQPIGNYDDGFVGSFDGGGHVIRNLTMNMPNTGSVGLFGYVGSGGQIQNLGLEDASITGNYQVGGLVGWLFQGMITHCYASSSVSGSDAIGGLVGRNNDGTIMDCYAKSAVYRGGSRFGGLVGWNVRGVIGNSYACGEITLSSTGGGLVGANLPGTIDNCFWDVETSGTANSDGGTGLFTAEMKQEGTYLSGGWDLVGETDNGSEDVWCVADGMDYPWLWWEKSVYISESSFAFTGKEDGLDPDEQQLILINRSAEPMNWEVAGEGIPGWVRIPIDSGELGSREGVEVAIGADLSGLGWGEYFHELDFNREGSGENIGIVEVGLRVVGPMIRLSPSPIVFEALEGGVNPAEQKLTIQNAGGAVLNWRIDTESVAPWLWIDRYEGNLAENEQDEVILNADVNDLAAGLYEYDLTVNDSYAENDPQVASVMLFVASGRELDVPQQYATIQAAIDEANDFDLVVVADGTYTGHGNRDIDFKGKAITVRSANGPERCIIDCEGALGQLHRGFDFHNGEDHSSILEGFTVTGGVAERGGAISCVGSSPWVRDCIIEDNRTTLDPSTPSGSGYAGGRGGGIYCESSSIVLGECVIRDNETCAGESWTRLYFSGGVGGDGGGVYCDGDSYPTITKCVIEGNRTGDGGEGHDDDYDGFKGGDGGQGAGIYCHQAVISNCIITNNTAGDGAEPCTFGCSGVFGGSGGGVWCVAAEISNCTIVYNVTGVGLEWDGSDDGTGGGIHCGSNATVTNCILTENAQDQIFGTGTVSYSNVAGGWGGTGNIDAEPLFVDMDNGDYRLLPSSPCVDAGTNEPVDGLMNDDIGGFVRVVDGDHDGQAVVDMGAHEAFASEVPVVSAFPQEVMFISPAGDEGPFTQILTIVNLWDGLSEWTITKSESCPWLEVGSDTGLLARGESQEIALSADATGLGEGLYRCDLLVSPGSGQADRSCVKVLLLVMPPEALLVPDQYPTIQEAIDDANELATVIVMPGTYYENVGFHGKNIVLRSIDPDDWETVERTVIHGSYYGSGVYFSGSEGPECQLQGFTIMAGWALWDYGGGIYGGGTHATIKKCYIRDNSSPWSAAGIDDADGLIENCVIANSAYGSTGVGLGRCDGTIRNCTIIDNNTALYGCHGVIEECLIARNRGVGLSNCDGTIRNCTIIDNLPGDSSGGLSGCSGVIENCIIWGNSADEYGQIYESSTPRYSCYPNANDPNASNPNAIGQGNIAGDPLLAQAGHLKSAAGRWDSVWGQWFYDGVTSPCIDAGSPGFGLGDEFGEESNVRINMGAYGGTAEASRAPAGWGILSDMSNDRSVGMEDFGIAAELFGFVGERLAGDLDRDGLVGLGDLVVLVEEWMWP